MNKIKFHTPQVSLNSHTHHLIPNNIFKSFNKINPSTTLQQIPPSLKITAISILSSNKS